MTKSKFYIAAIIVLLISNFALLGFMLTHKTKRGTSPRDEIIKTLHLDATQTKALDSLIPLHQQAIRDKKRAIFKHKKELYSLLTLPNRVPKSDTLLHEIARMQKDIETINYEHFMDIKALCKAEQMNHFEVLSRKLADMFKPPIRRPQGR